ncbi:MAG TPA: hypothetical protein VHN10_05135, partial [Candidatus Acidoferrales bacterium]|nr:hypothetical protein [Candidatus Acidoferrales bacterium]
MSSQKQIVQADPAIVPVEGPTQADRAGSGFAGVANSARALNERAGVPRRGVNAEIDARANAGANAFGANNEQLPEKLQEALRRLVFQFSTESESTRRQEVRRIKQAHQFWRGLQYLWWSEQDQNWHLPFEQKMTDGSSIEDLPRYEFVTNIYQAFGLSLVSVLSQDVPRVRFFPSSAQAEEDVAAAKAATEVAGLVERNNRVGNLIVDEAFQLWTDGKVGAYVRFVVDGQRFGFHPETEIGAREVRIGGDVYVCPECSAETSAGDGVHGAVGEGQERIPRSARDDNRNRVAAGDDRDGGSGDNHNGTNTASGSSDGVGLDDSDGHLNSRRDAGATKSGAAGRHNNGAAEDSGDASNPPQCNFCGALLTEEDFVAAETVTVPSG